MPIIGKSRHSWLFWLTLDGPLCKLWQRILEALQPVLSRVVVHGEVHRVRGVGLGVEKEGAEAKLFLETINLQLVRVLTLK